MKLKLSTAIVAGLSLLFAAQAGAQAQAPAAPAPAPAPAPNAPVPAPTPPNNVRGQITAINGNVVTFHDQQAGTDTAVTVTTTTRYVKTSLLDASAIAVGNFVRVSSRDEIAAGATTVEANRIEIIAALPKVDNPNPHSIVGTVATATPSLTVTTAAGTTVTVTTTPRTRVIQSQPGTFSDLAVGSYAQARGKNDGTTFTATNVMIGGAPRKPAN